MKTQIPLSRLTQVVFLFIMLLVTVKVEAQCPPGNVTLSTQAAIDNFIVQYPNCTEITGNLTVDAPGATNLNGLNNLLRVTGQVNIVHNNALTDLSGLGNIKTVGGNFWLADNTVLQTITGLSALESTGTLYIGDNPQLTQIHSLSSLKTSSSFRIENNPVLQTVGGFSSLNAAAHFRIINNPNLNSIVPMNALTNISGQLVIERNNALQNLNGLSNINTIGGLIQISDNNILSDIAALQNVSISNAGLNIRNNPALSVCDLPNICTYMNNPTSSHPRDISGNAGNCLDIATLTAACTKPICPPGDVELLSQAHVNQFIIDYPNCTEIAGALLIGYTSATDISDLTPLNNITKVVGGFIIAQVAMTNVNGLSNLTSVGRLQISNNPNLTNLDGLNKLNHIGGDISIFENAALANVDGLSGVTGIGGNINIRQNIALTNLNGLTNLKTVNGDVRVFNNAILSDISGLRNIDPATIRDSGNSLGGLNISDNPALSVCNLPNFCAYLANSPSTHPRVISGNAGNCLNEYTLSQVDYFNLIATNTNNCQTNNGSLSFDIVRGPCADGAFYSLNGYNWIWTTNTTVTVSNLTARDYYVFITNKNNNGYPDISNVRYAKTTVGVNVPGGSGIDVFCQPDITLPFPLFAPYRLYAPTYQGVCGVTNTTISKLVITLPNGQIETLAPYDNQAQFYNTNPQTEGKYLFTYTITGQVGNNTITRTCTRTIFFKKISASTFASPICNAPQPVTAQACSASPVIATVNVSGLDPTPRDYGVRNIYISGKFPASFNGVMTLIAPNGARFELTKGNEFPQFDGSKGNLNVNITSCASSASKHVADNQPFTSNGTYRVSGSLINANNWHINPNGTWGLEICASTNVAWELHCFDIEFGSFCPILRDATVTGGCGTTGKGSINIFRSQIEASYCDDQDNDGIPNYGIEIGGNFYTFDPVRQSIRFEGLPGTYNVTFGRYSLNAQGVPSWSCTSGLYPITIPDTDTEKPVIIGCQTNKVINLGSNGSASFTSQHPTQVLDNCSVHSTGLNVRYLQGARNANGQILETANFTPGSSHTVNIIGSGVVEFEYWAKDNSNNTQICRYYVTVVGNPCTNDRVRPVFTGCPVSQIVQLGNDNKVTVNVTDPLYSDNCAVTTNKQEIFYLYGATNRDGDTYLTFSIDAGNSYPYEIHNEGLVVFKYTVGDAAGNFGYCYSYIRTLRNPDPCNFDIQAPVLTNCQSDITLILDANGEANFEMTDPDVADNCIISSRSLNINCYNGVLYNETSNNTYLDKLSYPDFYPGSKYTYYLKGAGNTVFQYSAIDQSGNISTCRTIITTVAPSTGALFNFGDVCASQGAKTYVPVTVSNFKKIGAFSFDVVVTSGVGIKFLGIENAGINNISSNVLGNGNLRISWDEPGGNDIDLADNFKLFDIVIEADATFTTPGRIEGRDLVLLSSVNSNGSIDGANICVTFTAYPKGIIKNPENTGHENVKVDLVSGFTAVANTTTAANGSFTFTNTNLTNRVVPFKNDELRRGVDISDVARIRRHFLEITPLTDNYKILAADVNRDGRINVLDVAYTNRVFLHKLNEFPGNTSWRFVPEYIGTAFNPLDVNLQDYIPLNGINVDDSQLNFISVKTGDVDHSALLKPEIVTESRVLPMQFSIPDTTLSGGTNIRIPVYISGNDPLSALSMIIQYDTLMLELTGVESSILTNFGAGNYTDLRGNILIGWDHPQAKSVNGAGTLMTLVFNSIQTSGQSLLSFNEVNAFDEDLNKYNVSTADGSVSYTTVSTADVHTQSYMKAIPNPFKEQVDVIIELPRLQDYTISVYDASGRLVHNRVIKPESTKQHLKLEDITDNGVYMIQLKSESISEVLKVIKI